MSTSFFADKVILVTGATGSIGSEIVQQLLPHNPKAIRLYSRDEHKQFLLQQKLQEHTNLRYLIGDVRDRERLFLALEDVDYVFHCAAYKHVPQCEYNSFEAVKTNVNGTQNLIDAAKERNVKRVLLVSTDKAVNPTNVMGATKLLAERLTISGMLHRGSSPVRLACVRFGNVIGSRGSVIPLFVSQALNGEPLRITDPDMTRFFMSITQAVSLTFRAMETMEGGELFILKMPVIRLGDLAEVIIEEVANVTGESPANPAQSIIGIRPGEKMEEVLMTEEESCLASEYDDMYVVASPLPHSGYTPPAGATPAQPMHEYASSALQTLSKDDIRVLVKEYLAVHISRSLLE